MTEEFRAAIEAAHNENIECYPNMIDRLRQCSALERAKDKTLYFDSVNENHASAVRWDAAAVSAAPSASAKPRPKKGLTEKALDVMTLLCCVGIMTASAIVAVAILLLW